MKSIRYSLCVLVLLWMGCGGDESTPDPVTLIAATINGATLVDGATNVPVEGQVELVFSAALDIPAFETVLSLTGGSAAPSYTISYANASSKAIVAVTGLEHSTQYNLTVAAGTIGANGQALSTTLNYSFTTVEDGIVRSMAPCTSASQDCYQTVSLQDNAQSSGDFGFYSNYPVYLENTEWEALKHVIIVVHGANRDAHNYFSFLTNTLSNEGLQESTILIAPEFKGSNGAGSSDLFWGSDWREGQRTESTAKISSFAVIDAILARLSDRVAFPVLEKVIITGHSSGALFSQLYGATNVAEPLHDHLSFEYVVANSQYFYYPDNQRYNEQTNQFYVPTGCNGYNRWPLGYTGAPAYVTSRTKVEIDANLLSRSMTYFLGNGTGADGSLNTADCEATLLGSTRFLRGEHIYNWLQTQYSGQNSSSKIIVNGIGHDGQAMYQSNEFKTIIQEVFN